MSDLKVQFAEYMMLRLQAALGDGEDFDLHFSGAERPISATWIASIALDEGAIVLNFVDSARYKQRVFRYDQLVEITFPRPSKS